MTIVDQTAVDAVRERVSRDFGPDIVAHDLAHLDRVAALSRTIARSEGHDEWLPQIVAYVHDYHRIAEAKSGGPIDSQDVLPQIRNLLDELGLDASTIEHIADAVLFNERYLIKGDTLDGGSATAHIVRDADKLDAIGAIGIGRAFMYGGSHGAPMWDASAERMTTYRPGATSSVIAHFYEKLVWLQREMLTATGQKIAADRIEFLITFLRRFHVEWGDAESAPVNGVDLMGSSPAESVTPLTPAHDRCSAAKLRQL
jgi:uncharacterized protein